MSEFDELFNVEYEGELSELVEAIEEIYGVTNVKAHQPVWREVDGELDIDIIYDSELTDRTLVAQHTEEINGVSQVLHG